MPYLIVDSVWGCDVVLGLFGQAGKTKSRRARPIDCVGNKGAETYVFSPIERPSQGEAQLRTHIPNKKPKQNKR